MSSRICPIAEGSVSDADLPAFYDYVKDADLSFDEMEQRIRFFVRRLQAFDLQPNERVGLLATNSVNYIAALFALHRLGASAMMLSLQLHPNDWRQQLKTAKSRLLIAEEPHLSKLDDQSRSSLLFKDLNNEFDKAARIVSPKPNELQVHKEASVIFTSSKTGHKKGVLLSINNFLSSAEASNALTRLTPGDSWVVSLPLYHVGGLGIIYRTVLARAQSRMVQDFSIENMAKLVSEGRVSHLSLVPTMLDSLVDLVEQQHPAKVSAYFARLKSIIIAGAASSESLLDKIRRYQLPVLSAWGMTETTAHCTCMSLDDPLEKVHTVGKPFYHTELRLVDDNGDEVAPGQVGEITVCGPTVCQGYLDPSVAQSPIIDGWLQTGDLGVLDEDGYLTIVGRKDDMFISGGENIHQGEIESIGLRYHNAQYCAVVPVEHPKWGQRPVMFVQPRDLKSFDAKEMEGFLRDNIAKIKVPDQIIQVEDMPRTAIGKIDYKELKQDYLP